MKTESESKTTEIDRAKPLSDAQTGAALTTSDPQTSKEWSDYINGNRMNVTGGYGGENQVEIIDRIRKQSFDAGAKWGNEIAQ